MGHLMNYITLGAVLAALAVVLGAFGAHGLQARIEPRMLEVYQTGVQYHMYHALGLILLGILTARNPDNTLLAWAAGALVAGIVLFSGSLYVLSISSVRWLGAITPLGGVAFIAGWCLLAIAAWKQGFD